MDDAPWAHMLPIIVSAITLLSSTVELARMVTRAELADEAVAFTFQNRHQTARFRLLDESGFVRPEAVQELSYFVRCWRTEKVRPLHPRLVEIVARVAEHFHAEDVLVISGYRARPYGAKHSKHFLGRAMDLTVPGVPAKEVAAWVWRSFRQVGVGYYPRQEFVHVDVREDGDVRWVDPSRHGESAHARYFTRPIEEALPPDAPRLAIDQAKMTFALAGVRL